MTAMHLFRRTAHLLDLQRRRESAAVNYLREFERSQFISQREITSIQFHRVRALLQHAFQHCPYYHRLLHDHDLHPSKLHSLQDLNRLPPLDKKTIQQRGLEMVAQNCHPRQLIRNQTGGSTGTPISFYLDRARQQSRWAATVRHNRWAGLDLGDRFAVLWGAPLDQPPFTWKRWLRSYLLEPCLFLDTSHLNEGILLSHVQHLKQFRPRVIVAYARAIVLLAQFIQSRHLGAYQPESIITSAEVLEPQERQLVEGVFGCRVFNRYGCREVSVIASECPAHDGLHLMAEGLYVEIEPLPGQAQLGEVLVTDLLNHAMPLIRYRIGDVAEFLPGRCSCGRELPRLRQVQGRVTDFLVGASGQLVSGVFLATYLVAYRPALGQVQIVQDRPGEVTYRLVPRDGVLTCADASYLLEGTRRHLGATARCAFEIVSVLPSEPSGKFLFSRSSVLPQYLGQ